jgi:hypothetical protein
MMNPRFQRLALLTGMDTQEALARHRVIVFAATGMALASLVIPDLYRRCGGEGGAGNNRAEESGRTFRRGAAG